MIVWRKKMLNLDAWDTAKLLITKGWELKEVPRHKIAPYENTLEYSRRCFAVMCGCDISDVDTEEIWVAFAERVFSINHYWNIIRRITGRSLMFSSSISNKQDVIVQAIISEISILKVEGYFELDESLIAGKE
jgi:hypothetical protein